MYAINLVAILGIPCNSDIARIVDHHPGRITGTTVIFTPPTPVGYGLYPRALGEPGQPALGVSQRDAAAIGDDEVSTHATGPTQLVTQDTTILITAGRARTDGRDSVQGQITGCATRI